MILQHCCRCCTAVLFRKGGTTPLKGGLDRSKPSTTFRGQVDRYWHTSNLPTAVQGTQRCEDWGLPGGGLSHAIYGVKHPTPNAHANVGHLQTVHHTLLSPQEPGAQECKAFGCSSIDRRRDTQQRERSQPHTLHRRASLRLFALHKIPEVRGYSSTAEENTRGARVINRIATATITILTAWQLTRPACVGDLGLASAALVPGPFLLATGDCRKACGHWTLEEVPAAPNTKNRDVFCTSTFAVLMQFSRV